MKLLVADGMRHRRGSGYGALSRQIIRGFAARGYEVLLQSGDSGWDELEPRAREQLEGLPRVAGGEAADLVLQVGQGISCRSYDRPSLIYTQHALGELPSSWRRALAAADGYIVPSEFDRRVFSRHFKHVSVAGQSSDPAVFSPRPVWRQEGAERFTFLFVGSFSYRKGVDVLLEAFLREFSAQEPVELWLQSPGSDAFNAVLPAIQRLNPLAHVRLSSRNLSPAWMSRLYNRVDCVVTLSRGEGWCMPLTEALLCGKPVVAPRSTAMAEYLDDEVAFMVETEERPVCEIDDPFAEQFVRAYGEPGITCFEPSVRAARDQLRSVFDDPEGALARAERGRERVLTTLTWDAAVDAMETALLELAAG